MSDEPTGSAYQPAPEPGQASPPAVEQPQFVTRADLETFSKDILAQMERVAQSQKDKAVSVVDKKLAQWEKRLAEQGIPVDDSLRQQARRELALNALREEDSEDEAAPPVSPTDRKYQASVKKVNALLEEGMADLNVSFEELRRMPEFQDFNWKDASNPAKDFADLEQRFTKVRESRSPTPTPPAGNPVVRLGPIQGGPAGDREQQIVARLQQLQKNPFAPGASNERSKLNAELEDMLKRRQ